MNSLRQGPLERSPLRAFDAVARRRNFRAAAQLFVRGTRKVELTSAGLALQRVVGPWLKQLDLTVRQLRVSHHRRPVAVTTFASL